MVYVKDSILVSRDKKGKVIWKFKCEFMDIWTNVSAAGRLKNVLILERLNSWQWHNLDGEQSKVKKTTDFTNKI